MTEEDTRFGENELDSTLDNELDSTEANDLDSLFADDELQEDAPVTREEYNRLIKGTKKLASELGRLKSQPVTQVKEKEETTTASHQSDDVSELFFAQVPQAELVQGDLKNIADKLYGGSILKAWKGESWIQEKAKALNDAKIADEENKSKISKPTPGSAPSRTDISKIKPEEVEKLTPEQKAQWLREQVKRERESVE